MRSTAYHQRLLDLIPPSFRAFVAARTGSHRSFVGPPERFDTAAASQFNLLTLLGLRAHHHVLDVGCGALRAGRLLIVYLEPDRYCGIEPQRWLVESAIRAEIGDSLVRIKRPLFDHNDGFRLGVFARSFDFIVASSIFSHASARQIDECLRAARPVMTEQSVFVASFVAGESSYAGDDWVYPGTVTYRLERLQELAGAHGLACEPLGWPYVYGANTQTWVAFSRAAGDAASGER